MEQNVNKILLHACCAICSAHPIERLKNSGYEVVVYFYNPNIFPSEEYERRLEAERTLCRHFGVELIEEEYRPEEFFEYVRGFETCPEKGARCLRPVFPPASGKKCTESARPWNRYIYHLNRNQSAQKLCDPDKDRRRNR